MQTSRRTCSSLSPAWSSARSSCCQPPGPPMPVSNRTTPLPAATAHALPCGTPGQGSGRRRRQTPGRTRSARASSRLRAGFVTRPCSQGPAGRVDPRRHELGQEAAIGVLSFVPLVALVVACGRSSRTTRERGGVFVLAIVISGIVDTGSPPSTSRTSTTTRGSARTARSCGSPCSASPTSPSRRSTGCSTCCPKGRAHPGRPRRRIGGAWYADPWGEAPFRWWDGQRWTDWVTGPPGQG